MSDEYSAGSGCSGWCGVCPTPCFLDGDSSEDRDHRIPDEDSLCPKWHNPDAECECDQGYFCYEEFAKYAEEDAESYPDAYDHSPGR